jgi:hypothetical protein
MITIQGHDLTPYLLSLQKEASVCQIGATLKLVVDLSYPQTLEVGQQVWVEAQGITFSGWITDLAYRRLACTVEVTAQDCQPLLDYLVAEDQISAGEDVAYWLNAILQMADMLGESVADTGYPTPVGYNFKLMTAREALHSLIGMSGLYFVESSGSYQARLRSLETLVPLVVTQPHDLKTLYSDNWIRNRVVAMGSSGSLPQMIYASGSLANDLLDPNGFVQSYIIYNSLLSDSAMAAGLVDRALDFFSDPLYIKSVSLANSTAAQLGYYVLSSEAEGIATQYTQKLQGAQLHQQLELDTRCHAIWGWQGAVLTETYTIQAVTDNGMSTVEL